MAKLKKIIGTEAFYDRVAPQYNGNMTAMDAMARSVFKEEVMKTVRGGTVLDFGGGTGQDLPWEMALFQKIYFLEPSGGMRYIAIQSQAPLSGNTEICFLDKLLDFTTWDALHLPFDEKVDAVVADFAVLNCISNLSLLFEKLSLVCKQGAHILAMVINTGPLSVQKNYSARVAIKSILNPCLKIYNNDGGSGHATYFFQKGFMKSASSPFFRFISWKPIKGSPFAIIHLSRI